MCASEGKYSAGALTVRFGSWGKIGEKSSTTEVTEEHREGRARSGDPEIGRSGDHPTTRKPRAAGARVIGRAERATTASQRLQKPEEQNHQGSSGELSPHHAKSARVGDPGEFTLHNFDHPPLAQLPAPLVGMRRVTEEVAQLVVNTLLGERSGDLVIGRSGHLKTNAATTASLNDERTQSGSGDRLALRGVRKEGHLGPSVAVNAPLVQDDGLRRGDLTPRGIRKDRAVMGAPFDASPMTNAPVNELGVMVLFGMVAALLGLQVESVQGRFPDCVAKREVAPGKWQYLRIEFEYESKNFHLHGHDPKGCDVIVCWRHNWRECPPEIEVIELSRIVGRR